MEPQPESGYVFLQRLGNHSGQFSANNSDFILPAKLPDELKQKVHIGAENYTFSLLGGTNETPQEDNDNFNFSLNLGTKVPKSRVVGLFLLEDKRHGN